MGEDGLSLGSTAMWQEGKKHVADFMGHFILCRVQPVAASGGFQAHRRTQRSTIQRCKK